MRRTNYHELKTGRSLVTLGFFLFKFLSEKTNKSSCDKTPGFLALLRMNFPQHKDDIWISSDAVRKFDRVYRRRQRLHRITILKINIATSFLLANFRPFYNLLNYNFWTVSNPPFYLPLHEKKREGSKIVTCKGFTLGDKVCLSGFLIWYLRPNSWNTLTVI